MAKKNKLNQWTAVDLSQLVIGENLSRTSKAKEDEGEWKEFVKSIQEKGLLHGLTVSRREDGKFNLISGFRRVKALKELGQTSAPAIVVDGNDGALNLVANLQQKQIGPVDAAIAFEKIGEKDKVSEGQLAGHIAKMIGKSPAWVRKVLSVRKLDKKLQQEVNDGLLDQTGAYLIERVEEENREALIAEAKAQAKEREETKKDASGRKAKKAKGKAGRVQQQDVAKAAAAMKERGVKSPKLDKIAQKQRTVNEFLNLIEGGLKGAGGKNLDSLADGMKKWFGMKLKDKELIALFMTVCGDE